MYCEGSCTNTRFLVQNKWKGHITVWTHLRRRAMRLAPAALLCLSARRCSESIPQTRPHGGLTSILVEVPNALGGLSPACPAPLLGWWDKTWLWVPRELLLVVDPGPGACSAPPQYYCLPSSHLVQTTWMQMEPSSGRQMLIVSLPQAAATSHNISLAPSCCIHAESRLLLTPIIQSAWMSDERLTQDTLKFKHLLKQDQGAGRAVLAVHRVAYQARGVHGSDLPGQQECVWRALQLEGTCAVQAAGPSPCPAGTKAVPSPACKINFAGY